MIYKKVNIIVKVSNGDFLKYRGVSDLLKFTTFIDEKHNGFRFMNVFDPTTKEQITSFTKGNPPTQKKVTV